MFYLGQSAHKLHLQEVMKCVIAALAVMVAAGPTTAAAQDRPNPPSTASEPQGFLLEPSVLTRVVVLGDENLALADLADGFYVDFGHMIPGAGWLSAGPGYRRWYKKDQVVADGSAAIVYPPFREAA